MIKKQRIYGLVLIGLGIFFLVATSPGKSLATDIAGSVLHHSGKSTSQGNSFLRGVLAGIGAPQTRANLDSLAAWLPHENSHAENNPMATERDEPGATLFNPDGVKNYPTAAEGEQATAATLEDGRYPGILAALQAGTGLCGRPQLAGEFLTWSANGYDSICLRRIETHMIVLTKAVQTCIACPSQWDAWDADGNYYYLRYRHGYGEIRRYQTPGWVEADEDQFIEVVATFEHGDSLDGSLSLEEFAGMSGVALSPDIERVAFWRHIHDSLAGEFAGDPAALARLGALLSGIPLDGE